MCVPVCISSRLKGAMYDDQYSLSLGRKEPRGRGITDFISVSKDQDLFILQKEFRGGSEKGKTGRREGGRTSGDKTHKQRMLWVRLWFKEGPNLSRNWRGRHRPRAAGSSTLAAGV